VTQRWRGSSDFTRASVLAPPIYLGSVYNQNHLSGTRDDGKSRYTAIPSSFGIISVIKSPGEVVLVLNRTEVYGRKLRFHSRFGPLISTPKLFQNRVPSCTSSYNFINTWTIRNVNYNYRVVKLYCLAPGSGITFPTRFHSRFPRSSADKGTSTF
jgi:hypothetical protein